MIPSTDNQQEAKCVCPGECLRCLHCDSIFQPRHCRTVTTCNDDEICGSESVAITGGNYLYNVGCFPKKTCEHNVSSTIDCLQCCSSDLCNVGLCHQPDYPSPRGPICFNCQVYDKTSSCSNIAFCAEDEVCNVKAKMEFTDMVYTSACTTKSQCLPRQSVNNVIVGKRSVHIDTREHEQKLCDICCESDVCNIDCDTALTAIDECDSSPCSHGTCIDEFNSYTCLCSPGFTGPQCQTDIDDCASSPCSNGFCIDKIDSYTCICNLGFTGSKCQTNIDDCVSSPCWNGTCIDKVDSYSCLCSPGFTDPQCQTELSDCVDVLENGGNTSGVYDIILNATNEIVTVYCDMDTDGGGWTVFQYRFNGSVDFYRNFSEYEFGFGNVKGEFWLGLHYIYELSKTSTVLRLDLESANGTTAFETFNSFSLSQGSSYRLYLGSSHGTAGDKEGMSYSKGFVFSTFDNERDQVSHQCADRDHGGWWYSNCANANLNGKYYTPGTDHDEAGVIYRSFMDELSLKSTKMMLRRDV